MNTTPTENESSEMAFRELRTVKNDQKYARLFNLYFDDLIFTAYYYLKNTQDAEDVVSEVFEKLLQITGESKQEDLKISEIEFKGFLHISVRNACIDLLRKQKTRNTILSRIGKSLKFWNQPEAYDKFELEAFDLILEQLSNREREIIQEHLNGLSNREIASKLTISELTVRNTLHNAKKRIRKIWFIFISR